jgi:hypothetical protein
VLQYDIKMTTGSFLKLIQKITVMVIALEWVCLGCIVERKDDAGVSVE